MLPTAATIRIKKRTGEKNLLKTGNLRAATGNFLVENQGIALISPDSSMDG
jgi:hypothetical protein